MSDMKCPFCQQELRKIHPTYVICDNCRITGEDKLWQELIRTRKALEIIKKEFHKEIMPDFAIIRDALKIVEQKDVK